MDVLEFMADSQPLVSPEKPSPIHTAPRNSGSSSNLPSSVMPQELTTSIALYMQTEHYTSELGKQTRTQSPKVVVPVLQPSCIDAPRTPARKRKNRDLTTPRSRKRFPPRGKKIVSSVEESTRKPKRARNLRVVIDPQVSVRLMNLSLVC